MKTRSCLLSLLRLFLLTLLIVVGVRAPSADQYFRELTYQDYLFRLYDYTEMSEGKPLLIEQTLVVSKNGREVFRETGYRWYIANEVPKLGVDITGTGQPNVVLSEYSGGAHWCTTNYIFELGDPFKVIKIRSHDFPVSFKELDGRPGLEIILLDTIFLFWKTGLPDSPTPKVILRYGQGGYRIATDLMKTPPMNRKEMLRHAKEIRTSTLWGRYECCPLDDRLLRVAVDLIYTGNAEQAREFADLAWPPSFPGKKEIVTELFQCQMRHSNYWKDIAAMNGLPPGPPIGDCPGPL